MPVGWGGGPENVQTDMSGEIGQYTKFFDREGLDFDIHRRSGLWSVVVWGYREISPVRVRNVKVMDDSDGGYHYEDSWLTQLKSFIASSEPRESLNDAFLDAYRAVKLRNG